MVNSIPAHGAIYSYGHTNGSQMSKRNHTAWPYGQDRPKLGSSIIILVLNHLGALICKTLDQWWSMSSFIQQEMSYIHISIHICIFKCMYRYIMRSIILCPNLITCPSRTPHRGVGSTLTKPSTRHGKNPPCAGTWHSAVPGSNGRMRTGLSVLKDTMPRNMSNLCLTTIAKHRFRASKCRKIFR